MQLRRIIIGLAAAILLVSSFPTTILATPPDNPTPDSAFSSGQILVKFKPGASLPEEAEVHHRLGGQVKGIISDIGVQVVSVPKGQAKDKAKAYRANPMVAYAEPDFVAQALGDPDDTYFTNQWGLIKVGAPQAWDVTTGNASINIAILDTGVDPDHPDLADKIISNINFSSSNTTDDVRSHGTHVAGIAAASTNNGVGVAGLGYDSSIMNVKVLGDDGTGSYSSVANGIIWAADNGAQIINLSLGGGESSQVMEDAVNYAWSKGVVVVAAAGNNGNDLPFYPAYYANCIAVAATYADDARASFSNYGDWVDVAAPGYSILSTYKNNNYMFMSGTSMATPFVAGLAALLFTTVSDTNGDGELNDEVRSRIEATCDDIGVSGIGSGRINAARAVGDVAPVPPGRISGQVTDTEDGSPIVGVTVSDGTRAALTDAVGQYTINDVAPGAYHVTAGKDGYESSSLTVTVLEGSTATADLSLTRIIVSGSITGTVTNAKDGSAIAGATVTDATRTTTTDATGKYTIVGVSPGTYEVTASKESYESSALMVTVLEGSTATADLSLTRIIVHGTITGTVTDAKDGSPIVGAAVTDGTGTTVTDATGAYTIADVPGGSYQVTASKSGYESSSVTLTVLEGSTATADLSLTRIIVPGSITGTVTNAKDGSAIAGATVTDGTRTTTTDATGKYTIADVPPGTYQVTATKSGYYSLSVAVTVVSGGSAVANFSLNQIPGSFSGTVTNAKDGSPVAGATVTEGTRMVLTDALGAYTINNVPPGSYQVIASKTGYYSSSLAVTLLPGSTVTADLSLNEIPGSITGAVTDATDGSAIAGAMVTDGTRIATTDATGKYTIGNVPPGTYQVAASKESYESSALAVTVLEGSTATADLSLTRLIVLGTITGSVTDAEDGSGIAGATVTDGTRTTLTDARGQYAISDVPPSSYQVVAAKDGYETASLIVNVLSEASAVADFSLNEVILPGSITGIVTDGQDGSPIAGATVTDGTRTTTTDATGAYTIVDVPPGTCQVTGGKSGYYSSSVAVTVVSGGSEVANFCLNQIPDSVNGTVTNAEDGSPVAGAMVTDGTRTTTTDAAGEYTIANVPPGAYKVTASKPGYYSSSLAVTVVSGGSTVASFSLNQIPGSITGTVTSAKNGSPIARATVTYGIRMTTTNSRGKYTIANVPPGTYQVTASKSGYYSSSVAVTVVSGGSTVASFSLNQIPGGIMGTVTNAKDGSPIVGATVTDGTRTTTTDAEGKYTIASVPPGTYRVTASTAGYYGASLKLTVVSGGSKVANFRLKQIPGTITGTVTSAKDGSPVARATVTLGTRRTTADRRGKYTITNVPPGSYQVTAGRWGYESVTSSAAVVSGRTMLANFSLNQTAPATNAMSVDNMRFIRSKTNLLVAVMWPR
jgi:subtilisin family serine protease